MVRCDHVENIVNIGVVGVFFMISSLYWNRNEINEVKALIDLISSLKNENTKLKDDIILKDSQISLLKKTIKSLAYENKTALETMQEMKSKLKIYTDYARSDSPYRKAHAQLQLRIDERPQVLPVPIPSSSSRSSTPNRSSSPIPRPSSPLFRNVTIYDDERAINKQNTKRPETKVAIPKSYAPTPVNTPNNTLDQAPSSPSLFLRPESPTFQPSASSPQSNGQPKKMEKQKMEQIAERLLRSYRTASPAAVSRAGICSISTLVTLLPLSRLQSK